ncbi:MAG: ATP-binding cassette domain-containing protein [Alphaproteobacteria bacterium]|nr:ATP-binding cassette domain-containing protein [Alphaproteobacteria bacterium]
MTTPLLLQMHSTECGAACLGSVLAFFGRWAPLTELRERCEVSRDGSTAAGIFRAARHYGLNCTGRSVEVGQITKLPLPLILFWEFNHFLILEGFDHRCFYLNDPATGRRTLTKQKFSQGFSGIALQFDPGPEFQTGGDRPSLFRQLPLWLTGAGSAIVNVSAAGLLLALLALMLPALLSIFVDRVLADGNPLGTYVAAVMAGTAILVYGLTWLKQRCLKRLAVRISVIAGNRSVSQLLRLPVEFFNHRLVGELTARILSIDRIAKGLSEQFVGLLVEVVTSAVFLAVMLAYNWMLALIVLGLGLLNGLAVYLVTRLKIDEGHAVRREQGLLLGIGMLMLQHADSLRMTAADDRFFQRWGGQQARELAANQRYAELGHFNNALPGLLLILGSATVLTVGATQVMTDQISLGTLVGFFFLAAMFLEPVGRFAEFIERCQALEIDMHRLEDITKSSEDPGFARRSSKIDSIPTFKGRLQLAGRVELRGVTFGYNRARPPLIKDFDLFVKPGQRVAILGSSGSGKSTLSRLVSGLYQPWSGEILFDGQPRHAIPEEVLRRSLSMVDQEVALFSASLRDNITLWNPAIPDEAIVTAARDACIHDDILRRPLGYATAVDEGGANFSGGQRQRLEIARALVGDPTVLILDEATSALDAATEEYVYDAIRRRGVTCLIVAHRLSTVRDCDEIIVLEKGATIQRGTHDTLMADNDGAYSKLVRSG